MKDLPKSRKEALATGETNYFTNRPCLRNHIDIRNARTGRCLACQREDAKERTRGDYFKSDEWKAYQREYHKNYVKTPEGKATKERATKRYQEKRRNEKRKRN